MMPANLKHAADTMKDVIHAKYSTNSHIKRVEPKATLENQAFGVDHGYFSLFGFKIENVLEFIKINKSPVQKVSRFNIPLSGNREIDNGLAGHSEDEQSLERLM